MGILLFAGSVAMNIDRAIVTFCSFGSQEKAKFLLRLAHALTVLARDTYEVGKEGVTRPTRLGLIDELQLRITSFVLALLENDPKRYPDDVLVKIILDHPEDQGLQRQVEEEFDRLVAQIEAAA